MAKVGHSSHSTRGTKPDNNDNRTQRGTAEKLFSSAQSKSLEIFGDINGTGLFDWRDEREPRVRMGTRSKVKAKTRH